jgi:class 3 adenylate cyclase
MPARTPRFRCSADATSPITSPARGTSRSAARIAPWFTEPDRILTRIEEFLTGSHGAPSQSHRALRTVLFTDIVASTQHAAATGDERWRAVLHRFGEITAELTQRFGGTVVKSTGDGYLATFDGPTQAIRCAEALCADAETLGIEIRAGMHTGECELLDADIGGLAVPIAARILGQAGAGDILVSRTVRDLVVGSGMSFEDRGTAPKPQTGANSGRPEEHTELADADADQ